MNIAARISTALLAASTFAFLTYSFFRRKRHCGIPSGLQAFKIEALPENDREKIKEFKSVFEYWGRVLQYDEQASDEVWAEDNIMPVFVKASEVRGEAHSRYFHECLNKFIAESVAKSKKGCCRDFARLLLIEGQKIGFNTYLISTTTHVANLYKLQGKWYVADLTDQLSVPENSAFNYKIPLERFIRCAANRKVNCKDVTVEYDGTRVPIEEFIQTH